VKSFRFIVAVLLAAALVPLPAMGGQPDVKKLPESGNTPRTKVSREALEILSKTSAAMAEVAAVVKLTVVNISSTKTIRARGVPQPFFNDPFFREFFDERFPWMDGQRKLKQASLGSGVVVDAQGYILTSNHIVKDADEIKIKTADKREFVGKVIGTDPKTDLAVIKIDAKNLPAITIGDSDALQVGETVIAVGNPYGLSQTVTSGIVSATGRANVGIADYEDFIQTDAAINPGNSGGALVNIRGELVGINTAIFSTSGGYQGIGFAVPSNMAKVVMESLIRNGKVIRGWLGVSIQPVTSELAKQFGLKEEKGALVSEVFEDSPAKQAGLQDGDVIISYDGREVADPTQLRNMVAGTSPGKQIEIGYLRDGKLNKAFVTIKEQPEAEKTTLGETEETLLDGVVVANITAEMRRMYDIPPRVAGVIVTDIDQESPAAGTLQRGDVIMAINRQPIRSVREYMHTVAGLRGEQGVLLKVFRRGVTLYLTLSTDQQ